MMASGSEVVSAGVAYVSLINDGAWLRWSAQARLMRHDIVETPVSRAGVSSLVGGC